MAHYSLYNLRIILILTLGSLTYGYANSVLTYTLGRPGFLAYFNLDNNSAYANAIMGTINGIFSAGGVAGAFTVAFMCDKYGRKRTMNVAALVSILGGILLAGSVNAPMLIVARLVSGWGVSMLVVLIPIFQAEVSPSSARGLFGGQHGVWIVAANAITGWIGFGTYYSTNWSFQWRFPFALQCVCPLALLCCSHWVPESPRWLLMQRRSSESWDIISRLHTDGQDQPYAEKEFYQMVQQTELDMKLWAKGGGVWQLVTKPSLRKRMWMGFFTQYAAQSTGAMVVYNYMVNLYKELGFSGGITIMLSATYVTVATLANLVAAVIMDRVGRVRLLTVGLLGCMVSLSLECWMEARYVSPSNHTGNSLGVLFIFCFICFYAGGIDATSYVYCSEIFATHVRAQGMAFSMAGTFLSTIIFLEVGPTALATIGWRYYLVFICLTAVNLVIILWYFPETKGLPLEEINAKFGDQVAVRLEDENLNNPHSHGESRLHEKDSGSSAIGGGKGDIDA